MLSFFIILLQLEMEMNQFTNKQSFISKNNL